MKGRRQSKKRDAILELMRSTASHPGAQWVYDRLKPEYPDLSLGTVYRNINLFKKEGAVNYLGVVNGEERFDGTVAPHPHVCCSECGIITDLDEAVFSQILGPSRAEIPGFAIDVRNTVFFGLCDACKCGGKKREVQETAVVDRCNI